MKYLAPCHLCGRQMNMKESDTLTPSRVVWKNLDIGEGKYVKSYHDRANCEKFDGMCWEIHCATHTGGCGLSLSADSEAEVIGKWNNRKGNQERWLETVVTCGDYERATMEVVRQLRMVAQHLTERAYPKIYAARILPIGSEDLNAEDAYIELSLACIRANSVKL